MPRMGAGARDHMTERQRILLETISARDKAESLLRSLVESKGELESHLAAERQRDKFQIVTGRSSIDNAVSSTRRMIETLNRAIERCREMPDAEMVVTCRPDRLVRG
jgi:hypothetical protein